MSSLATSRRTQLDLLARACARGERARLCVLAGDDSADSVATQFLSLEENVLLLHWPGGNLAATLTRGVPVKVFFAYDGDRYSFKAAVRGRGARRLPGKGLVSTLVLSLPLRVERKQERANFRISLASLDPPIQARCASVTERDLKFTLRVTNASCAGIGGVTADPVADRLGVGDLLWIEFALPGDEHKIEFVVRVAYCQTTGQLGNQRTRLGCTFCPTDDPITHQHNLQRLERFIREQQRATPEHAVATPVRRW